MRDVIGNDLSVVTTENAHNIDNPYMNIGFTGGYDYRLKMAYISKHGPERFTLGFFTDALIFTGFYDIEPSAFVQYDDRLLELKDSNCSIIFFNSFSSFICCSKLSMLFFFSLC